MHKVMLIDDDVPMLKVLQQMIEWDSLNLHVVGSTYSSTKAMQMFQETSPDIVITDIGIPQKSGIELATIFRQQKPDTRVIFLTCHEDFHYAQQAVKLNADDYLLKDKLTAEQLEQSLVKSIRLLKSKPMAIEQEVSNYNRELFKQGLLQKAMSGAHAKSTVGYAAQLGISWDYPWFMLGLVHIQYSSYATHYTKSNLPLIYYAIYNIAIEVSAFYEGITPFVEQGHLVILYNYRLDLAHNASSRMQSYMQELCYKCCEFLKLQVSLLVMPDKLELGTLGSAYHQLVQEKKEFYKAKDLKVIDRNDLQQHVFFPMPQGFLDPYKSDLERAILKNDQEVMKSIVSRIEMTAEESRIEPVELVRELSMTLRSMELMFSRWKSNEEIYVYLSSARSLKDVMTLVLRKLEHIAQYRQQGSGPVIKEPKLQVIQQYIDQHLSDNITSIDIARYLYLNSSYFSRYFKRLTGINFTDYVHQYKMKIATNMLKSSSQSLESLAMGLGYSDRTYFSKVFKKYVGTTPSEYKTRNATHRSIK
ncbi:DNA-binding response regulator [Paenibacillus selenitireducens]|uniref:DNA-binding response regulator n=2 Tax=Paenibacillus selenitireducens TaxID=1324314 RepID=A0A1T2XFU3_9BACL|nr:DNA-binding response regulator [Paenibacillus selenitireducens]